MVGKRKREIERWVLGLVLGAFGRLKALMKLIFI